MTSRHARMWLCVACLASVAVIGCGGDEEQGAATGAEQPGVEVPDGLVSVPWSHEATRGDGKVVEISYESWNGRGCPKFERHLVEETAATVTIDVLMRPASARCPRTAAAVGFANISLDRPLAGRALAHAPVTER